ncbi:hypothetical protein [Campylobacter sp. JMF_03 NE3]|uniref:hypothetical protein n=1 Tax=Campylobacter sp. JMF_03 NE3 TaxID=2983831 RepID=UPI0022EA06B6|nr:hypothetical protein [Campylobacter sp. JMF_03 NE3]MDA3053113.1 hypothetical protein [Campylobacter sp. JMF_03 NE3]
MLIIYDNVLDPCLKYDDKGVCIHGHKKCAICDGSNGKYFNSDTGSCSEDCEIIPNLKFRADCHCKQQNLGSYVSSRIVTTFTNSDDDDEGTSSTVCKVTCSNGEFDAEEIYCSVDDTLLEQSDSSTGSNGDNNSNNDDNEDPSGGNNNPNNDDNEDPSGGSSGGGSSGGGSSGGGSSGGGSSGGGSSGGGNSGGGNSGGGNSGTSGGENSGTSGDSGTTAPENPENSETPSGDCEGEDCGNVDYNGIDDLNKNVSEGVGKILDMFDNAKDSVIGVYDKIKGGELSSFNSFCGMNCGRKFEFTIPKYKTIPIEVNLCSVTDSVKNVLYLVFYAFFVTLFSVSLFKIIIRLI